LTPLDNVEGSQVTGPYATLLVIEPARLSIADRGLTSATNARRGLCIRFRQPVQGIEPTGRLRHPALTVTVAEVDGSPPPSPAMTANSCRRLERTEPSPLPDPPDEP
jgi:hypothetical protein